MNVTDFVACYGDDPAMLERTLKDRFGMLLQGNCERELWSSVNCVVGESGVIQRDGQESVDQLEVVVTIKEQEGKGRGLFATQGLQEGTRIIRESPVACSRYLQNQPSFEKLSEIECLAISWILNETPFGISDRSSNKENTYTNDFELANALDAHFQHQRSKTAEFLHQTIRVYSILEKNNISANAWDIFTKLNQIPTNTFAIHQLEDSIDHSDVVTRVEQRKSGIGIYPLSSMINHSCDPNAHVYFDASGVINIQASRNIEMGEEIHISYGCVHSSLDKPKRIQLLMENYYFECSCPACENENSEVSYFLCTHCSEPLKHRLDDLRCGKCNKGFVLKSFENKEKQATKLLGSGDANLRYNRLGKAAEDFKGALKVWKSIVSLQDYRVGKTYDRLAECFALQGNFKEAAAYCQLSVDIVEAIFGLNAIETANEYVKLCELYFNAR